MKKGFLYSILHILIVSVSASSEACSIYKQISTQNTKQKLTSFIQCVGYLIQNQKIQELADIQRSIPAQDQNIYLEALDSQIKLLQAIEDQIITTKSTCRPNLQWAQNETYIFIAAKLSHRWDSPPCLKTISENYNLTNNTLFFENICLMNNIQEQLFNKTSEPLVIKKDGVGTYSITLKKSDQGIWPALFKSGQTIPLWDEVMERGNGTRAKFLQIRQKFQQQKTKHSQSDI